MSQTMTRTQVYIQPELLRAAKNQAKTQKINLSQFIRDCVEESMIAKNKLQSLTHNPLMKIKPFKMDNPIEYKESWELSKKIDEIVYDL
jgi:hypothetical protein